MKHITITIMTQNKSFKVGKHSITISNINGKTEVKMQGPASDLEIEQVLKYCIKEGILKSNEPIITRVKVPTLESVAHFTGGIFVKTKENKTKIQVILIKLIIITTFITAIWMILYHKTN